MPYNADILDRLDQLCDSQSELLANFAAIAALLQQDHENFNGVDQGKHKKLTLPFPSPAHPVPSVNEYDMLVRGKNIGGSLVSNLLAFQGPGVTAGNSIASYATATYQGVGTSIGQTLRLPSGVLIKWALWDQVQIFAGNNSNLHGISWTTTGSNEIFTNQRWGYVIPVSINPAWVIQNSFITGDFAQQSGNTDNPAVFHVYDLTNPAILQFLAFVGVPGMGNFPSRIRLYIGGLFALAIGD